MKGWMPKVVSSCGWLKNLFLEASSHKCGVYYPKRDWASSAKWTRSVTNFLAPMLKFSETEKQFSSLDISSSEYVEYLLLLAGELCKYLQLRVAGEQFLHSTWLNGTFDLSTVQYIV